MACRLTLLLTLTLTLTLTLPTVGYAAPGSMIDSLLADLTRDQMTQDVPVGFGRWEKQKGLWPSSVKLNFNGLPPVSTVLRRGIQFPDNNMFVANFVLVALLEAEELGSIRLDESLVASAVSAIASHRNHDSVAATGDPMLPIFNFWPEKAINGSYVSTPSNLVDPLDHIHPSDSFETIVASYMKSLGLSAYIPLVHGLTDWPVGLIKFFRVPPDSDDTAVNLALVAAMNDAGGPGATTRFHDAAKPLAASDASIGAGMGYYLKYAYRPFSDDDAHNMLDPRAYYWMRFFLRDIESEYTAKGAVQELKDYALFSTWFQDLPELRALFTSGRSAFNRMPLGVNNVDPVVNANVVFGLTRYVLASVARGDGVPLWFDASLQTMYGNAVRLLEYVLLNPTTTLFDRTDLVLVYYPPLYDFYNFVGRAYARLVAAPSLPADVPVFAQARDVLGKALRGEGTAQLLRKAQTDAHGTYWEDFLGMKELRPQHEDRIFTSASVLNALFDTWAEPAVKCAGANPPPANGKLLRPDTPDTVRAALSKGVSRLDTVLRDASVQAHELDNCFFSGSVKGWPESLPFYYPTNMLEDLQTAAPVSCKLSNPTPDIVAAVRGLIPEDEYQQKLRNVCFGQPVPQKFSGFNSPASVFPFWSSPSLSRATALLSLAKWENVQRCGSEAKSHM